MPERHPTGESVVVTGAAGLLGRALLEAAPPGWQVRGICRQDLDLRDTAAVQRALAGWRPWCIIHCAACTGVDQAENEPWRAYEDNVLATWNLASAAAVWEAALVFLSTDYIFDGRAHRPYDEFAQPSPLNVYGRSKWLAEQLVRQQLRRHFIVRTSGLFGPGGRHFVGRVLDRARRGESLRVVDDQICARTYAPDLARALWRLVSSPLYGVYHLTNQGSSSWFAFTQDVLCRAGLFEVDLDPVTSAELRLPACRPPYSVLDNFCWRLTGHPPLRPIEEAVEEYLRSEESS